jgi:hypothetical protein
MTTNAKIGHGTLFQIFDTGQSPDAWVTVAEVTNVTPPALARDAVEATHTESPEGWHEFIPGLKDGGQVSIDLNFIPGGPGTALLLSTFDLAAALQARVMFPDGDPLASPITATVWTFTAICTGFAPEAPVDGKMAATATFKITGKPTFNPAP